MNEIPRRFALVFVLSACTAGPSAFEQGDPPRGAVRGELAIYVADLDDGRAEIQHFLRTGRDGRERRLRFDSAPDLSPDTVLDVWGVPEGDGLRVTRFEVVGKPDVSVTQRALTNGSQFRARKIAFVLVDIGGGVNLTEAQAAIRLFGTGATDASLRQYYVEASYGRQDLGGQIFGPLKYPMTTCDTRGLATALRPMVPDGFDHYLWYMGSRATACAWTGLASTGSPDRPSRDTWYNGSSNCIVLVQEPGHNFGMKHSSSMTCGTTPFHDVPEGNCTHSEYGDSYDPMGRACRHMNSYQKAYQGWYGGCNVVDVTSSGTFTLLPTELPCDGIQALQIPMPKARPFSRSGGGGADSIVTLTHYYVELRSSLGFDRGLTPSVQIRVSGDIRLRTQGGINTWLLDMNRATTAQDGLGAGGTYTDPAGTLSIAVQSIDATKAVVQVTIQGGTGAPTCMDGTALKDPAAGPETCAVTPSVPGAAPPLNLPDGGARDVTPAPTVDAMRAPDSSLSSDATMTSAQDAAPARLDTASDSPSSPDLAMMMMAGPDAVGVDRPSASGGQGGAAGGAPSGTGGAPMMTAAAKSDGCGCRMGGSARRTGGGAQAMVLIVVALGFGRMSRSRRRKLARS